MRKGFFKELNALIADFQKAGADYESHIGQGVSLESQCGEILRNAIPNKLKEVFSTNDYQIKGSIGTGRVSKCPWVAIMNKKETKPERQVKINTHHNLCSHHDRHDA